MFSSILETKIFHNQIKSIIDGSLVTMINILKDPDKQVRITSSWCIERIAENFPEVIEDESRCGLFIDAILNNLKSNSKIVTHLCTAIYHFTKYLKPNPDQVSSKIKLTNF
jgi:hypothetical protein